ncbi:MAG: MerR family transcriptional regulator [Deltaproteobacteria bacterium]|nr:MerR family transcriptional regulator [Deltaproteobacteria bacterium]
MSIPNPVPTFEDVVIPDKVFFRIGEVAKITGVKAYVLRFWEGEFPTLRPQKGKSGQRRYRRPDIEQVLRIRELLWNRKFTIAGARSELRGGKDRERTMLVGQQPLPIAEPEPEPPAEAMTIDAGPKTLDGYRTDSLRLMREELLTLRRKVRDLAQDPEQ